MKLLVLTLFAVGIFWRAHAATTIDAGNRYAYGANVGWIDWRGDTDHGAVITEYVCSGNLYSGNVGWINLGGGNPTNGIRYQNLSANDFGVNHDELGNLRGFAWGANIGWINFESIGAPKVNLLTGQFNGYVWSVNCGWISLSNVFAHVQTDSITPGVLDGNGLAIAWELTHFGQTAIDANADPDHDGMSNLQEYQAGTNPNDANDHLGITGFDVSFTGGIANETVVWMSHPWRQYQIQRRTSLVSETWLDTGLLITPNTGTSTTWTLQRPGPISECFLRVQAVRPLSLQ
jgi:hypothetical protein